MPDLFDVKPLPDVKTLVIVDLENQQNYIKEMEEFNNKNSNDVFFLVVYSKLCATKISPSVHSLVIESTQEMLLT